MVLEPLGSDVFWIAVGSVGTIVTLVLIYHQARTSRMISAAEFLLKMVEKFESKEMRNNRKKLTSIINRNREDYKAIDACQEVANFFDDVGLLLRKKVVPIELVWSSFSYWIGRYYELLKGYIFWARKTDKDPAYFDQFEYLAKKALKFEEKKRNKKIVITTEQLEEFVHEEMQLGTAS